MKLINALFISIVTIVVTACHDDHATFPNLKDGTYHIDIFNNRGQKILTREGKAIGLGTESVVEMHDPKYGSLAKEDSLSTFATLLLYTDVTYPSPCWDESTFWPVRAGSAEVFLYEHWYSISKDWSYESTFGQIRIIESNEKILKGDFNIRMHVSKPILSEENIPIVEWTANPKWGEEITIIGYFISSR